MKPIASIKLSPKNYAGLVNLGNRVASSLSGNLNYLTPLPTALSLLSDVASVVTAIGVWGPKGNRGSHADLLDLRQKAITLAQTLKSLSQYVQNTAQTAAGSDYALMAAILGTSGFDVTNHRSPQGILEAVQNFHAAVSPRYNPNQVKLMWKKPLNVITKGNVKNYLIMKGTTAVFSAAVQIGTSTKTKFVDTNHTGAPQTWFYWIIPVNNEGSGAISEVVNVSLFSI